MSRERIRIDLDRDGDVWTAHVAARDFEGSPDEPVDVSLVGSEYTGSGPADALERVGQELDEREIARIQRERGI